MFETKEIPIEWDGRFKETSVLAGVYVYVLKLESDNSEVNILSADLTVIR